MGQVRTPGYRVEYTTSSSIAIEPSCWWVRSSCYHAGESEPKSGRRAGGL